jgi:division protein CdvB (Snf7/Vps24/ESCRT-III family)
VILETAGDSTRVGR